MEGEGVWATCLQETCYDMLPGPIQMDLSLDGLLCSAGLRTAGKPDTDGPALFFCFE
jgi:hypothetical protein